MRTLSTPVRGLPLRVTVRRERESRRHAVLSKLKMRSALGDISDTLPLHACQPEICRIQPADVSRYRIGMEGASPCAAALGLTHARPATPHEEGAPPCSAARGADPPQPRTPHEEGAPPCSAVRGADHHPNPEPPTRKEHRHARQLVGMTPARTPEPPSRREHRPCAALSGRTRHDSAM